MKYYTYWSIVDSPSSTSSSSVSLVIFIISFCIFLAILKFKKKDFEKKFHLSIVSLFLILSLSGYIYLEFFLKDSNPKRLNELLESNRVQAVEGEISNFERIVAYARSGKTTLEHFKVDSVEFGYLDNALYKFNYFGGNHSKTFHDGLKVRITYLKERKTNNGIQKIEIAENQ